MRRFFIVIFILFLIVSCRGSTNQFIQRPPTYLPTALSPTDTLVSPSSTPTISPTLTPSWPPATPTAEATVTPTAGYDAFEVLYHPDDYLYVGDQVSLEVISPTGLDVKDELQYVDPPTRIGHGSCQLQRLGYRSQEPPCLVMTK
jgi:hypothetical protein